MAIDKGTTLPITQLSGLQINYQDKNSCFNLPIMTTTERDALVNTTDPANPIKNGTMIFNSDTNAVEYYQMKKETKKWINIGGGDVIGPDKTEESTIAIFDGTSGKIIKDSKVPITRVPEVVLNDSSLTVTSLYEISNLKILHFGDISVPGSIHTANIMMDGYSPITLQTQGVAPNETICTIFNDSIGAGSSSPSALVEINSTVGGFLNARMTTAERDALNTPVDGLMLFNTDTKKLTLRAANSWVEMGNGQGSGTVTSVGLTNTDSNLSITNTPITTSGNIQVNLNNKLTIGTITLNNTGNHGYTLSSPSSLTQNLTLTLPSTVGTAGQVLSTDGSGNLSWVNNGSGSGGAPISAKYLLTESNDALGSAIVLPVTNTGIGGNLYIGNGAGSNSVTHDNIGIGYQTLDALANTSNSNIAIGPQALGQAVNSQCNTVIGYQSMYGLTTDSSGTYNNTAIGYQTFLKLTDPISPGNASINNTAIGYKAGASQSSYRMCTFLGAGTDTNAAKLILATAIGAGTTVSTSYSIALSSESFSCRVGIGKASPQYSLDINNTLATDGQPLNSSCAILLSKTNKNPSPPTGQYDVCLWANKGSTNGALFLQSNTGGIYKIDTTSQTAPASEAKIPVLTAEEIQNLQEIALGAIVYDSTNDTVIISTKSGWQNLTRTPYNPQSLSAGI